MPGNRQSFYQPDDKGAVQKIIDDKRKRDTAKGIVASVDITGLDVRVQIGGSSKYTPVEVMRNINLKIGDRVSLERDSFSGRWVVVNAYSVGAAQGEIATSQSPTTTVQVFAPTSVTVVPGVRCLTVRWRPPSDEADLLYEIEVADDQSGTNNFILKTAGTDITFATLVTKSMRVRTLGPDFNRSGWTAWLDGTPLPIDQDIDNLRVLIEIGW